MSCPSLRIRLGSASLALLSLLTVPASAQSSRTWSAEHGVLPDQHCYFDRSTAFDGQAVISGSALRVSGAATTDALYFMQSGADLTLPPVWVITARLKVESDIGAEPAATSASIGFTTAPDKGNVLFIGMDRIFLWSAGFTIDVEYMTDTHSDFQDYRIEVHPDDVVKVFVGASVTPALEGSILSLTDFEEVPTLGWGDGTSHASGVTYWQSVSHNGNTPKTCPLFHDDLDGSASSEIIATTPELGGYPWTGAGLQPSGQFRFAAGGGAEDVGPNFGNAMVNSVFTAPYALSELATGEVLHLSVGMRNRAGVPHANLLESSRVDLGSTTSGNIMLGELATGYAWGANSDDGDAIGSGVSTGTPGRFDLHLYLDPRDEFGDGPILNAAFRLGEGCLVPGTIQDLSTGTVVAALRLVRNVDDEVLFDDLRLESMPAPDLTSVVRFHDALDGATGAEIIGTTPAVGGAAWVGGGLQSSGAFRFADGGGVADAGPNFRNSNAAVFSTLGAGIDLAALTPESVLRMRVSMRNVAPDAGTNLFESTRVDLGTLAGGTIYLGELDTGGDYGASDQTLVDMLSSVPTTQPAITALELLLDPLDAIGDGAAYNALLRVNGGPPIRGLLAAVTPTTVITRVSLVRNLDDEVLFDDLTLDVTCVPPSVLDAMSDVQALHTMRFAVAPNPFRAEVGLRLTLPRDGALRVSVHDVAGRLVREVHDGALAAGEHLFHWDGQDATGRRADAGVYFVRARSGDRVLAARLVRMR